MGTYRESRLARAEKLRGWSETNAQRSDEKYDAVRAISDMIPLGQPILVGHHSERRHRRDIGRIDAGMRASVELERKAEAQARTAETIVAQAEGSIYDDDPDAVERLSEKIAALEAKREQMKAANAEYRRQHRDELKAMSPYQRGQSIPYPSYALQNLGGNISRCRERLTRLQRQAVTGPADRVITARFDSECADCGAQLERGELIRYNRQHGARCNPVCPVSNEPESGMLW